jgi:arginase
MARIGIVGVPSQGAGRPFEVARGPGALRAAGLVAALGERHDVFDYGDVALPQPRGLRDPATNVVDPAGLSALVWAVDQAVGSVLAGGRFPLVVGGDCPLLLGCLSAASRIRGRTGLLHVDGHEDAYAPAQSPSGAWADMEIAFALGLAELTWDEELRFAQPWLEPAELTILGARDHAELESYGVESLAGQVELVDAISLAAEPRRHTSSAVERLAAATPGGFWLHLDWDVLSSEAMPAMTNPNPGGLGWPELGKVARAALASPAVAGWDVAVYNLDLDPDGRCAIRIVDFVLESLDALPR